MYRAGQEKLPEPPGDLSWVLSELHVFHAVSLEKMPKLLTRVQKLFPAPRSLSHEDEEPAVTELFGGGMYHLGTILPPHSGLLGFGHACLRRNLREQIEWLDLHLESLLPSTAILHITIVLSTEGHSWYHNLLTSRYSAYRFTPTWFPWRVDKVGMSFYPAERVMQQTINDSLGKFERDTRKLILRLLRIKKTWLAEKTDDNNDCNCIELYEASANCNAAVFEERIEGHFHWFSAIGAQPFYCYSHGGNVVFPEPEGRPALALAMFTPSWDLPADPGSSEAINARHFAKQECLDGLACGWSANRLATELGEATDQLREEVYRRMSRTGFLWHWFGSLIRRYRRNFPTFVAVDRFRLEMGPGGLES